MMKKVAGWIVLALCFGCQDFDPLDGVTISLDYDLFETFVSFRFVDGSTGDLIGAEDLNSVTASFGGKHNSAILSQVGERPDQISSVFGLVSVALNPFDPHRPTADQPVEFSLSASAAGFEDASFSFAIPDTGYFTYSVIMPPAGWDPEKPNNLNLRIGGIESGKVEADIEVLTPGNKFGLELPAGVILTDNEGVPASGDLLVTLSQYQTFAQTGIRDQRILTIRREDQLTTMAVDPVLLTNIEISTTEGKAVTQFIGDSPVHMEFELTNWTQDSEALQVWAKENEGEIWNYEGEAQIHKDDSLYRGKFDLKHLSLYTAGHASTTREVAGQVTISFTRPFIDDTFEGEARIFDENGDLLHRIPVTFSEDGLNLSFTVPADQAAAIRLYASSADYEFRTSPGTIQISSNQTEFNESISLTPLRCPFSGKVIIDRDTEFPYYPIAARIRIKHGSTGSTLKTMNINITEEQDQYPFFLMLPESTPIDCTIEPRTLANDFTASQSTISFSASCNESAELPYAVSSNTCMLSGQVIFTGMGVDAGESHQISLKIIRNSDARTIHNLNVTAIAPNSTYTLQLPVPVSTPVTLSFESINPSNPLTISPEQLNLENPCSDRIQASIAYSSSLIKLSGQINFSLDPEITREVLPIKVAYLDWRTEEVMHENLFDIHKDNPVLNYNTLVEEKPLFIRVTRNDPNGLFVTDPFILRVPDPTNPTNDWRIDLIKTEKKLVHATLKVVCPAGEIRPTIQGYYRIPGENWKELFIVGGNLLIMAEMKATYEVGMIFDGQMTDSTFTVTSQQINMNFELDPADCEKMGWGK